MSRKLTPRSTVEYLRKEAKRWLKALRAQDAEARARLERALPDAPVEPGLRHVQHALAREYGFDGWTTLRNALAGVAMIADRDEAGDHAALVARFLEYACPDWRVGGPSARGRYRHAAERILRRHPEIAREDLHTAVACGELEAVERVLRERPEAATTAGGPRGWPALLYLCNARLSHPPARDNAVPIARLLLQHGADPNTSYPGGSEEIRYTAIASVIGEGEEEAAPHPKREELVALLLERGAEPYDIQVLYNTHFRGDILWFLKLIHEHSARRGRQADWADPDWRMLDMQGYGCGARYLLGIAVANDDLALAEWLLEHGASANAPSPPGSPGRKSTRRSLHEEALLRGFTDMADLLLRHGATPGALPAEGMEAFVAACLRSDRDAIRTLAGRNPEYLRRSTALFEVIRLDRVDIAEYLLDLGVPIEIEDEKRTRPLHVAAAHDAVRVASLLIARGAEIDPVETMWGNTPLDSAVYHQLPRMIALLSPHSRDIRNLVYTGNVERVRELLADEPGLARLVTANGATLLMWLPDDEAGALALVDLLLAHGADVSLRDRNGLTAGDRAHLRGMEEVAGLLRSGNDSEER